MACTPRVLLPRLHAHCVPRPRTTAPSARHSSRRLASQFNLAVVLTNQVCADPGAMAAYCAATPTCAAPSCRSSPQPSREASPGPLSPYTRQVCARREEGGGRARARARVRHAHFATQGEGRYAHRQDHRLAVARRAGGDVPDYRGRHQRREWRRRRWATQLRNKAEGGVTRPFDFSVGFGTRLE